MVKTYIEDCYILGTTLLYLDEVTFERLEQIKNNLMIRGIESKLNSESLECTVLEWHDFFEFKEDKTISLTKSVSDNKCLVEMIFHSVLSDRVKEDVLNSIFNYLKQKIILFPKNKIK